jgi:allene oxide cyclase
VYEINEHDRDSPAFLPFSTINIAKFINNNGDAGFLPNLWSTLSGGFKQGLGDLVPFSNKIYDSSLRMRLGVTAGMTMVVKAYPGKGQSHQKKQKFFAANRYEAMYTFYMGDLGHVSAQGPFVTFEDTLLTITGGAGLFREAKGVVHLHNITPFKLFYTFHVRGVPELPSILTSTPVEPSEDVQPCREAVSCQPGFALPNYTD